MSARTRFTAPQGVALHALDLDDGTDRFVIDTGGVVDSNPALAGDGTLLIGSETGELWAIADR